MYLAARCEKPEVQLQNLLRQVIGELHDETVAGIRASEQPRGKLKLVRGID